MGDPHQKILAHLDSELEQQEGWEEKYPESLSNKEKILKKTKMKKKYLSNLQPHLNSIMQASPSVKEYLFMLFNQSHKQFEAVRHMLPPIYVLSVQATAYDYACDKTLSVAIKGSVAEAKALFKPPDSQDGKSDTGAEEKQTTEHWWSRLKVQLVNKLKMLKRYQLSIMLDLKCKDDSVLQLTFY